ncbi:hypothetical protein SAMN06295960_3862 [Paenibacillus aquistagni]|uniref:Uncharacterized protein n=1 Tax=Paenibacillus aquistagni TaxID=1852522 RepID=A0A1X7LN45_9BACL|nr:hypothetical protein SAMN06295960_3862 [Paenibacillus aquistagni]
MYTSLLISDKEIAGYLYIILNLYNGHLQDSYLEYNSK